MLETIWFVLWGILWAVYFLLDGFDLGIGTLLPFLTKTENERRTAYNAMGPFWDGNEVWLITAGGATFAAFPGTYATMFSTLYTPLMLLLFALIFRGVSFEFRSKIDSKLWKQIWDVSMTAGSFLPAVLFGVAFANIFKGIPFDQYYVMQGNLWSLLNPYGLAGGILFALSFTYHGAIWLALKSTGSLSEKSRKTAKKLWPVLAVAAVGFLSMSAKFTDLYDNYFQKPILFVIPVIAATGLVLSFLCVRTSLWLAWGFSGMWIVFSTLFGVAGLYPRLFPSSIDPGFSMTIENSASSPLTLKIMLTVALIFVPIVIAYQVWAHYLFRHHITDADLQKKESY
ncbi:cytochrome d ubiquinol oxidase subunit II [bacterium]|nr:cytochrome d ubiquinol oxidase subunit II [candidate division CSSED10-310 bacterium]